MKQELLKALADDYSRRIILKTIQQSCSVEDISQSENIPISTAYRRINEMKDCGLLIVEKTVITDEGRKYELYRSPFKEFRVELRERELNVDVVLNEDLAGRLSMLWLLLRS